MVPCSNEHTVLPAHCFPAEWHPIMLAHGGHVSLGGKLPVSGVLSLMDVDMVSALAQVSTAVAAEAMRYHLETRVSNLSKPNAEHMELGPIQGGQGHHLREIWGAEAPFQMQDYQNLQNSKCFKSSKNHITHQHGSSGGGNDGF